MSIELTNGPDEDESRNTLFLWGGAALVVFGAGLILSTPLARRYLSTVGIPNLAGLTLPKDLQRYLRLRSM